MIDFNDVRYEDEATFLRLPRGLRIYLEHALKECQITDWRIMAYSEALRCLPEDFIIPSHGEPSLIFVSHYNREDMLKKLREIQHDPDIIRWLDAGCERLIRDLYS